MNDDWTSVRVSRKVAERGRRIRDMLIAKGGTALPKDLRDGVEIPSKTDPNSVRKFGVGQVIDLALTALECELQKGGRREDG